MLVTDDEELYSRAKIMRLHGINKDIWNRYTSKTISWEYDVVAPGFKYNMPDVSAAIGLAQLEKAEFFRERREQCARIYYNELSEVTEIDLPVCNVPMEHHAWHLFPIVINPSSLISRDEFIQEMARFGIGTSVHYKPLHRMTYYKEEYKLDKNLFPGTERIWKGTVSLPIYPDLSDLSKLYICNSIKKIVTTNPEK